MTYQSFDGHGIDVAVKRADDLDKKALAYIATHPACWVLDLGCGAGGQSVRMAAAGAQVTAIDQYDFSEQFRMYSQSLAGLRFNQGDIQHLTPLVREVRFDIVLCQRTIHYVPYRIAQAILRQLRAHTTDKLFISVTGCDSLVGETYPYNTKPIDQRFGELSSQGKDWFSIMEPVCLYTQSEFITLLESAGWLVAECWLSAFGNIKAVCSK